MQILNLPALLQNKNTQIGLFPWKRSVLQNPDRERTNQSTGICLELGLPYNNLGYYIITNITYRHYSVYKNDGITAWLIEANRSYIFRKELKEWNFKTFIVKSSKGQTLHSLKCMSHQVFKCSTSKDKQLEESNNTNFFLFFFFFASKDCDYFGE